MANEYVKIDFQDDRRVLCGGHDIGPTNKTLRVSAGFHTFTLDGDSNYTPAKHELEVEETTEDEPLIIKFTKIVIAFVIALLAVGITGCAHHPINGKLNTIDPDAGYRFKNTRANALNTDEVFVIVAFSGGGTRAAALSYGVLEELAATTITVNGVEKSLLDEVDIISTVSGGSFTGAYYALNGKPPWPDYEKNFLNKNVTLGLALGVLNPINWPKLASPHYDRIDMAADYYDRLIFKHHTFANLNPQSRPFLVINSTDMSLVRRFEFTQDQFDLMSSALSDVPMARAVAASSAFPFLLSPLTLNNYRLTTNDQDVPQWIHDGLRSSRQKHPRDYAEAASYESYLNASERPYVHLLDGGLSDNVGLRGPYYALTTTARPWTLYSNLNETMKHLLIVTVNARNGTRPDWDGKEDAPGVIGVFSTVANGPMGSHSEDSVQNIVDLVTELNKERKVRGTDLNKVFVSHVEVNFQDVASKKTREELLKIGTNYNLSKERVELLRKTGRELFRHSEGLKKFREQLTPH